MGFSPTSRLSFFGRVFQRTTSSSSRELSPRDTDTIANPITPPEPARTFSRFNICSFRKRFFNSTIDESYTSTNGVNGVSTPLQDTSKSPTKSADTHRSSDDSEQSDLEAQIPCKTRRFSYDPRSFGQRLIASARVNQKLETSKIILIPFNKSYKYSLVITLIITGAFLNPRMLPKWIGFEWASPEDLCQHADGKLDEIQVQLFNLTHLRDSKQFLKQQQYTLDCMNRSAADFYHGKTGNPPRFLWPKECDSTKARVSLNETTCVEQKANVCKRVNAFARLFASITGDCVQKVGPDLCVEGTNAERSDSLFQLEKERNGLTQNFTKVDTQPIASTAEKKVDKVINKLMMQFDLAADCFIIYNVFAILVGIPFIITKREKTSRVVSATLGLTKMMFIVVFIMVISLYDSASVILNDTDFPRMFQNFLNDPCFVNPQFSSKRVGMIVDVCNNISLIDQQRDYTLQTMDTMFYDTRLFGHCKDDNREIAIHPKLEAMDSIRKAYRNGNISNPGVCNATELDEHTSVAPDSQRASKWKALFGSGVLAQLLLKFVFTTWIVHCFAYVEPMVLHNGKVELWGSKTKTFLTDEDEEAIRRFARDTHLIPFIFFSALLVVEVILFSYSIYTSVNGVGELPIRNHTLSQSNTTVLRCPSSLTL